MSQFRVEESRIIDAQPQRIYDVIADYDVGHKAILPKEFTDMTVEQGGKGAGTVVRLTVKVMGSERVTQHSVSEPEPGRVLVERANDGSTVTTFTVEPVSAAQSRVTITTDFKASPGIMGMIEKLATPAVAHRMYREELGKLAEYVRHS
jgi:ribosome-associated toxin RatA of RatAB toxin-antitoxin module